MKTGGHPAWRLWSARGPLSKHVLHYGEKGQGWAKRNWHSSPYPGQRKVGQKEREPIGLGHTEIESRGQANVLLG